MKTILFLKKLVLLLVLLPFLGNSAKVWSTPKNNASQTKVAVYDKYMQQGYVATAQREYQIALSFFQQALQVRPGDKYALTAIKNVEGYSKRARNARLVFLPIGKPGNRISAASRSGNSCSNSEQLPIPLVPNTDFQFTATAYPTLFFYIPPNTAQAFRLAVEDENDRQLYAKSFTAIPKSGIISISLASQIPLKTGKKYKWIFSLVCDTQDVDRDIDIEGVIEFIQPDPYLSTQLKTTLPEQLPVLYATTGYWYDTLASLANLRRQRPNDINIKTDWEDLLNSVGLESVAKAPLLKAF